MRTTQRSGRVGSARHNDRSFLKGSNASEFAQHIHREKMSENYYWTCNGISDFHESERAYYEAHYKASLDAKNEAYIKSRHKERCKSIDDLLNGQKTKPEELLLQIGKKGNSVDLETFQKCVGEYIAYLEKWNKEHGNHMHILNCAIHVDETTIHAHIHRVWDYEGKNGLTLGQNKALEQAGVELPNPNEKIGRYNNRKMTFDAMMLKRFQQICIDNGLTIETEPRVNQKHKDKADYIAEQMQKELDEKELQLTSLREQIKEAATMLTEEQVKSIEAKPQMFGDNVTITSEAFKRLKKTSKAYKQEHEARERAEADLRRLEASNDNIKAEASKKVAEAEYEASVGIAKKEAELQRYKKILEAHPELLGLGETSIGIDLSH